MSRILVCDIILMGVVIDDGCCYRCIYKFNFGMFVECSLFTSFRLKIVI